MHAVKVLVIDDSPTFLNWLHRFLLTCDSIRVVGAFKSSWDALENVGQLTPDVVITDLAMPFISGFTVIHQIRSTFDHVGVVALSMYNSQEYADGALLVGAHAFVNKSDLKEKLIPAILGAYEVSHGSE